MRVVALPREAYSAWSIVCLSCKEIIVTPMTRMGAAVTVTPDGRGGFIEVPDDPGAVAQKMKAPWNALRKMVETYTGRPPCIMDAMQEQKAELWWSPTSGFAATKGSGSDWEELDDGVKVCCLNRDDLLRTKIAIGEVNPTQLEQKLPSTLGLTGPCQVTIVRPSNLATAPASQPGVNDAARRAASRKCREARDLLGKIDLRRATKTSTVWESTSTSKPKKPRTVETTETDSEWANRIVSGIQKTAGKVPDPKTLQSDPWYFEQLSEIRALLDEAAKSARSNSEGAVFDRLKRAAEHLKSVADNF